MGGRRRRSRRSYAVELVLAGLLALLVAAFNLGWFEAFGRWFGEQFKP